MDALVAERIQSKHAKLPSGCWEWQGAIGNHGYGLVTVQGTSRLAHRASYEIAHGAIPDGMLVLHRCDNRPCVNPEHLFLGSQADNVRDMVGKGRNRAKGPRGELSPRHKLTREDVMAIRAEQGRRSGEAIAKEYGVTRSAIHSVWHRKTWAWLP